MATGNGNPSPFTPTSASTLSESPASAGSLSDSPASLSSGNIADPTGKIDRMARTAHQTIDQLADKADPTREKLHSSVDQAAEAIKAKADRLGKVQDEWMTSMRECVREHPIASIATALAVGMLLDRLLATR